VQIRFDQGPAGVAEVFAAPRRMVVAWEAAEVPGALAALDAARAGGLWLAGYASYELGYALEPRLLPLMPQGRRLPLLCFGVYDAPQVAGPLQVGPAGLGEWRPVWDAARYARAFERLRDLIGAGDLYQANLTFSMQGQVTGTPEAIYAALKRDQPVGHGVLVEQAGLPALLSRSPELFFRTDADGMIATRPMKGTQPRDADPEVDAVLRDFLAGDPKNRAENLMIVDLLRNDLSRICAVGSVRVPELYRVESYATVHQMTSLVQGRLLDDVTLGRILTALFPCGSVTGAPKVRAMQVIRDLEPAPREIYCGAIGWAGPDGRSSFNVAIRTLMIDGAEAVLNVGGGVIWDSTAASEYEEALWKARFARPFQTAPA